jgi:hypothetical protein
VTRSRTDDHRQQVEVADSGVVLQAGWEFWLDSVSDARRAADPTDMSSTAYRRSPRHIDVPADVVAPNRARSRAQALGHEMGS